MDTLYPSACIGSATKDLAVESWLKGLARVCIERESGRLFPARPAEPSHQAIWSGRDGGWRETRVCVCPDAGKNDREGEALC